MIILDTNVLSEQMRLVPETAVDNWLRRQDPVALFTTSVCQAEILSGISLLADGRRKAALKEAADRIFALFGARLLPFDSASAQAYAEVARLRRALGRPIAGFDAQIAAIALSRGFALATRNVKDFEAVGLDIVNPWAANQA